MNSFDEIFNPNHQMRTHSNNDTGDHRIVVTKHTHCANDIYKYDTDDNTLLLT